MDAASPLSFYSHPIIHIPLPRVLLDLQHRYPCGFRSTVSLASSLVEVREVSCSAIPNLIMRLSISLCVRVCASLRILAEGLGSPMETISFTSTLSFCSDIIFACEVELLKFVDRCCLVASKFTIRTNGRQDEDKNFRSVPLVRCVFF